MRLFGDYHLAVYLHLANPLTSSAHKDKEKEKRENIVQVHFLQPEVVKNGPKYIKMYRG